MPLKTPAWWYRRHADGAPWWRPFLWPLSLVWRAVNAVKRANSQPYRSSLFVISIGNLTLGGSGKTPVTGEILRLLYNAGRKAVGLSKGYGGKLDGPLLVEPGRHSAAEVGDEPLMLAQYHHFVVAKSRPAGLKLIEAGDTDIAVVDDAHQNLQIAKDLHILVIDGDVKDGAWPFGDGGVFPYGPMREPFRIGLKRADLCVVWLPDEVTEPDAGLLSLLAPIPVFTARLAARAPKIASPVFGFAAIAKPWKFEATLRAQGFEVAGFKGFADHAEIPVDQLESLSREAEARGAQLITTQKDFVKLPSAWRTRILNLPIEARFDDEAGFLAALMTTMDNRA